ncbi:HEAT repeat domain-containing protein [Saccharopolyspora sp. NPDC002578]
MRTVFLHGDGDRFAASAAALSDRFGARPEAPDLVDVLLRDKCARDGLLARWTAADLTRFLTEVVPRHLVLPRWSAVPELLHDWVGFLDAEGLLMAGGDPVRVLHAAIDRAVPAYLAAMAEPAEWGPEKFWALSAREHGVDLGAEGAFERFVRQVEDGEAAVDRELLRGIEERAEREPLPVPAHWLPPMRVPVEAAPEVEAARSPIAGSMAALHGWAGPGRLLGEGVELAAELGCGPEVALLCAAWAERVHLVRIIDGRVVPGAIGTALLAEPGVLWTRLWQSFVLLDEVVGRESAALDGLLDGEDAFPELVQAVLTALYTHPDAVPFEQVVSLVLHALAEDGGEARPAVARVVERVLDLWERMGVLRRYRTELPEVVARIEAFAPGSADRTVVELLPLGVWAAHGSLRAFGFVAPTVPEAVALPAEVVVLALPGSPPDVVEEVVSGWVAARGRSAAAAELGELLRRVDDPELRLGALWLLEHTGDEGVAVVRGLRADPVCGPSARMWLRVRPDEREEPPLPGDELVVALDAMAVTAQTDAVAFLADFRTRSTPDQLAVLDELVRAEHARADLVLGVVAAEHPDEQVSRAARRCLDRLNTA